MSTVIEVGGSFERDAVVALYAANHWSSAQKPDLLMAALAHSHSVVTARLEGR